MLCWIKNTAAGTIARMISFYFPLWISIAYCMYVYWNIRSAICGAYNSSLSTCETLHYTPSVTGLAMFSWSLNSKCAFPTDLSNFQRAMNLSVITVSNPSPYSSSF
eukprot:1731881-Amphidinium_carterae.1